MESSQLRSMSICQKTYGILIIIPFLLFVACATSGTASKGSGKYSDWNGFIDELEIVKPFSMNAYSKVIVLPLNTSAVILPPKTENTYEPLTKVISRVDQIFGEGLSKGLKDLKNVSSESSKGPTSEAGVLIIQAKIFEMNPGSRALRYFVGFGAGKMVVGIQGEVIDAMNSQVYLRFKHARASAYGGVGGDYESLLSENTRDVGEDIGKMLAKMQ